MSDDVSRPSCMPHVLLVFLFWMRPDRFSRSYLFSLLVNLFCFWLIRLHWIKTTSSTNSGRFTTQWLHFLSEVHDRLRGKFINTSGWEWESVWWVYFPFSEDSREISSYSCLSYISEHVNDCRVVACDRKTSERNLHASIYLLRSSFKIVGGEDWKSDAKRVI